MEYALRLSKWVRSRKCENNLKMYTIKRSGNLVYRRVGVKFTKIKNVKNVIFTPFEILFSSLYLDITEVVLTEAQG